MENKSTTSFDKVHAIEMRGKGRIWATFGIGNGVYTAYTYQIFPRHIQRLAVTCRQSWLICDIAANNAESNTYTATAAHHPRHDADTDAAATTAAATTRAPRQSMAGGNAHMALLPLGNAHLLYGVQHVLVRHINLFAVVRGKALQIAAFTLLQSETHKKQSKSNENVQKSLPKACSCTSAVWEQQ